MTTNREMERIVRSWLEPGLTTLTDDVLDPVLDQLPATPQRRRWSARRLPFMNPLAKYALAAAAVVVVAIVGFNLLGASNQGDVGAVPPSSVAPASEAPPSSPPPLVPSNGVIEPGRYRWTSPGGEVAFTLPDGWTGAPDGSIAKNVDTPAESGLGLYLPGNRYEVTHVYTDACFSENALEPIGDTVDDLVAALDAQESTDVVVGDVAAGSVVGQRVEVVEAPGLDRSQCRWGAEGPLQIWADPNETGFFALAPDYWGIAYVFDVDGERFVFNATFGPEASEADVDEVDAIVESIEFSPH